MNQQIEFTEDDFNWNHELNLPQRIVDDMYINKKNIHSKYDGELYDFWFGSENTPEKYSVPEILRRKRVLKGFLTVL